MHNEMQSPRKPFMTWPEIIALLSIIGMLIALLVPAKQGSGSSPGMHCANNMKQIAAALHAYHEIYQSFPPARTVDANGKPLHSWRVLVLPYLEADSLIQQIRLDEPWDSEYNRQFHDQMPGVFSCPVAPQAKGKTFYQVLTGAGTYFPDAECRSLDDDALDKKNTVLLVESMIPCCWMAPMDMTVESLENDATNMGSMKSHHRGHPNVIIADGSAVFRRQDEIIAKCRTRSTE